MCCRAVLATVQMVFMPGTCLVFMLWYDDEAQNAKIYSDYSLTKTLLKQPTATDFV